MPSYMVPLPSVNITASGTATITLNTIPKTAHGRILHLRRFLFKAAFAPSFTTAPTIVGNNNLVQQCDFFDGRMYRFQGGFNAMRARERIHQSCVKVPEANISPTTGQTRYLRRSLYLGPTNMVNSNSDFLLPVGALENGTLQVTFCPLTSLSADTTAVTGTLYPYAECVELDEIRIPPAIQFMAYTAGAPDYQIAGRAAFLNLFALNSGSYDAISAGDFGSFTVDLGQGDIIPTIPADVLTAAYQSDMNADETNTFQGEPVGATDSNARQMDHNSTTLLTPQASDLQPIIWTPVGGKITKAPLADANGRVRWNGTQSTAVLLAERILSQPRNVSGAIADAAFKAIGKGMGAVSVKTYSKETYDGPYLEFMPIKVAVAQ